MTDTTTLQQGPDREDTVSVGQSVAVAVASALLMFTVVGLIASHGALSGPRTGLTPSVFAVSVSPEVQAVGAVPAAQRVPLKPATGGQGFQLTVPARQCVVVETGLSGGANGTGELMIPALEPGHYILKLGMHDVLVTAVQR